MAQGKPIWRTGFDTVERAAARPLESLVQSAGFADVLVAVAKLQREARIHGERQLSRYLHFWNLPAATDVRRISRRVAQLEAEIRALRRELEHEPAATPTRPMP